jgi:hypothetical protein
VKDDLVAFNREASAAFEPADRPFEPGVFECLDPSAVIAHDVVVVFTASQDRLKARTVEPDLDAMHVAVAGELIE